MFLVVHLNRVYLHIPQSLTIFPYFSPKKTQRDEDKRVFPERSSLPHRCDFSRDGLDGICRHWTNCKNPLTPFKAAELTD